MCQYQEESYVKPDPSGVNVDSTKQMQAAMTPGHPDFIPDSRVLAAAKEAETLLLAKIAAREAHAGTRSSPVWCWCCGV